MALITESFLTANDNLLTSSFGGIKSLVHNSNLSDNPQVFTLWVGSLSIDPAGRRLRATSSPGIDNIVVSVVDTLPAWVAATVYTLGQYRQPTAANGKRYKVTTAGTSHASVQPTWPTTPIGATVTDGTVVWTLVSLKHATTEVKLAATEGGLSGATPGASLSLGTDILNGTGNSVPIWVSVSNAVTTGGNDSVNPDLDLELNSVTEYQG